MLEKNKDIQHIARSVAIIVGCIIAGLVYLYAARVLHHNTANRHWQNKRYYARAENTANLLLRDSCIPLLKSGYLVVRRGDDMTSYMLAQMNETDKTYSHCGLAIIENGQAFIYHCIGGEDNPDEMMKREPASTWFSPANNLAFGIFKYDLHDSILPAVEKQLTQYYNNKIKFDMDFDLSTDDRLYCSELIYKVINKATNDAKYIPTATKYNRSYVGIDNLYLNARTKQVCQVRYK